VSRIELARRAVNDLDRLPDPIAARVLDRLEALAADPTKRSHDVKTLTGHRPWRRLRVGEYRILFRTSGEVTLVARVIDRRDLDRALKALPD